MMVNVFYNMVDTFFVGKTNDPNQVAAVSLTMPIYLLLMAFGAIYGIGGASYISRSLGAKNYDKAKQTSSFAFFASVATGLVCMTVFLIFMKQILKLSGASINTYQFAKDYLMIVAFGAIFVICQMSMGQIVRSEGSSKEAMIGMILGTVINIILDPIMILYMKMGVAGAAWATIIGNACSTFYYIWHIAKKSTFLSVKLKDFSMHDDILKNVFAIGLPVFINNVLMSCGFVPELIGDETVILKQNSFKRGETLHVQFEADEPIRMRLLDLYGVELEVTDTQSGELLTMPMAPGMYLLEFIYYGGKREVNKVIVK